MFVRPNGFLSSKEAPAHLYEHTRILDHGYMHLVEHMGHDERVIEAARMSNTKGFISWEEYWETCAVTGAKKHFPKGDEGLLKFLYTKKHCYDAQTEVLTQRGFVKWSEVLSTDKLGQWDNEAHTLVYEQATLVDFDHKGQMYRVNHGGVDLLVTPEHKMYVKTKEYQSSTKTQHWSIPKLVTALQLNDQSMVKYIKTAPKNRGELADLGQFPLHNDRNALLSLIGFFVGDGHAPRDGTDVISFHLRKQRKVLYLRELCYALGWELKELANDNYVVVNSNLSKIFRSNFYSDLDIKIIPSYLLDLTREEAGYLLDGLKNSDGSVKRGAWEFFTTSKQVADSVQLLVLHNGGSASIACNDGHIHRVMVHSRMLEPVINQGQVNTTWEHYEGKVYCAQTRTGILVVRRNGKIVLSGNSTPFEMCEICIVVQAPIMVFREWHRHRMASYNEMSARYIPLPDLNYIPTIDRMLMINRANKQANAVVGSSELTITEAVEANRRLAVGYEKCEEIYQANLAAGVPKELARLIVPVGRYSRMMAKTDLRNWLAFMTLRAAPDAQWEIQQYAHQVGVYIKELFPKVWNLFVENPPWGRS